MKNKEIFTDVGFNSLEAEIIVVLSKIPDMTLDELSKSITFSKTSISEALKRLTSMNIVDFFIKDKSKNFYLNHTSKINKLIDNKVELLELSKIKIRDFLSNTYESNNSIKGSRVKECHGIQETKQFFLDMLYERPDEIFTLCFSSSYPDELWEFMNNVYIPKRVQLGIKCNLISNVPYLDATNNIQLRKRKPINTKEIKVNIDVYNDTVFILTYSDNYHGMKIRNTSLVRFFKSLA